MMHHQRQTLRLFIFVEFHAALTEHIIEAKHKKAASEC